MGKIQGVYGHIKDSVAMLVRINSDLREMVIIVSKN